MDQQAVDTLHAQISQLQGEIARMRDFVEEYVVAWDEGMAIDGYLIIKARQVLEETK
jgi:hypothetical protein